MLVFGERHYAANTLLPNAGVSWLGPTWVLAGAEEDHPWAREAAAGPPQVAGVSPRPKRIVNVADVDVVSRERGEVSSEWRDLGRAAGSERTGIKHVTVAPGHLSMPPHCHSAEEEIFVVLEGSGTLELLGVRRGLARLRDGARASIPLARVDRRATRRRRGSPTPSVPGPTG